MSCVSKRRGKWTLDFKDQTGTRRWIQTEWSADKDKPKAEKLLAAYEHQIDDGRFEAKSEQRDFAELIETYLAQLDVRKATRVDYLSIINTHLKVHFGTMKLRAIKPLEVEKFRAWMQGRKNQSGKPLAVRTINKSLTLLSMMLKHAEGHGWMVSNPCEHVRKLKTSIDAKRRALDGNILTVAECKRLYEKADGPRDPVLFRMAVETGMRQGELLGLRWADIDWASNRVLVRQSVRKGEDSAPKTASSLRPIGLTPTLLSELRVWKLACPRPEPHSKVQDLVFPNTAGHFECPHNLLRRSFHPALRRAGLRQIRFHDLRHTCASLMLADGVGIKHVQAQLGHASANVTLDVYSHLMPDSGSPGADAMASIFGGSKVVAEVQSELSAGTLTHASEGAPEAFPPGSEVVAKLVPQRGFEPLTHALRMRCSTN
jgi:integrase